MLGKVRLRMKYYAAWIVRRCRELGLSNWDMFRLLQILYGKYSLDVLSAEEREMFGQFLSRARVVSR